MHILIVEDHPTNRKLLKVTLEAEGFSTVDAADGREALAILEQGEPVDAILSDIFMPGMDGFRLCHAVRKSERFGHLPFVIYTSTYTSSDDEKLALQAGADRYIRKPCPTAALVRALQEVVAGANGRVPHERASGELELTREYTEALIKKLEDKNANLEQAAARQKMVVELSQQALAMALPMAGVPGAATGLEALLQQAVRLVRAALGLERCAVWETLPDGQTLRLRGQEPLAAGGAAGAVEEVPASSKPVSILEDALVASESTGAVAVAIPGSNRSFGILEGCAAAPRSFRAEDVHFVEAIASVLGQAIDRWQAEEAIQILARFPSENPNPVLRLSGDGTLLYANEASGPLLEEWGCQVGGQVPAFWREQVADALEIRSHTTVEVECQRRVYAFVIAPVVQAGYVDLYGRDITERIRAEEAQREAQQFSEALNRINEALHASLDTGEIMQRLVSEGAAALGCETAAVSLRRDGRWLVSQVHGMPASLVGAQMDDDGERHAMLALRTRQPVAVGDALVDERVNRDHMRRHNIRAVLVAPLIVRDEPFGALFFNYHSRPQLFSDAQIQFAAQLASTAAIALENGRLFQEHSRDEEALREGEERLSLAFQATQDGVWDWNIETGAVLYSPRWKQMLGYSEAEIEPHVSAWDGLLHPDDRDRAWQLVASVLRGEREYEMEFRLRHKDGHYVPILSRGLPVRREAGGPIVRIVGTHLDLTERKQAEARIRQQNAVLSAINRIFATALEAPTEEELGEACLAVVEEITGSRFGFIGQIGADGLLHSIAISDPSWEACQMSGPAEHPQQPGGFPLHGIYGRVLLDGKGFFTNDPDSHPDRIGTPPGHPPLTAFVGVPLVRDRRVIGMIAAGNREGGYAQEQLEALEALAPAIVEALMRKRAEEALHQQQEWLRVTLTSIGDGVIATDLQGAIRFLNPVAASLTGWAPEEALGQPIERVFSTINEQTGQPAETPCARAVEERCTVSLANHTMLLARDGREIPIEDSAAPILDAAGGVAGAVLVFHDVTEKRRVLQALRQSEERYRTLFERIQEGFFLCQPVCDPGGQVRDFIYLEANPAFERIVGRTRDWIIGNRGGEVVETVTPDLLTGFGQVMATGQPSRFEFYSRVLGRHFEVLAFQPAQELLAALVADITKRKQSEEALEQAHYEAERHLAQLETVLEHLSEGLLVTDLDGNILRWNPAALKAYGFAGPDDFPRSLLEFSGMVELCLPDGQVLPPERWPLARILRGETLHHLELSVRRPETDWQRTFLYSGTLARDRDGQPLLAVLRVTDITERKHAEAEAEEGKRILDALMDSVPEGITIADAPDGKIRMVSRHGQELLGGPHPGVTAEQVAAQWNVYYTDGVTPVANADLPMVRAVKRGETVREVEMIHVSSSGQRLMLSYNAGPIRDPSGRITGGVVAWRDVSELKEAERRHSRILASAMNGFWVSDTRGRLLEVNDALCRMLGYSREEMLTMGIADIEAVETPSGVLGRIAALQKKGMDHFESQHRRKDGVVIDVEVNVTYLETGGGQVVAFVQDISERKKRTKDLERLNRTLTAHSHSDRALLRATDEAEYMQEVCRIIVEDCGHAMVWIGLAEEDEARTVRPVAYAGFEEGYLETLSITWDDTERGRGPTGTAVRTGKPSFCRNMLTDPKFIPWRGEALRRGYASSLVLPLLENGRAFGALTIYFREPDPFTEDEIALLASLADDLALGIRTIRLGEARAKAEQALRASEERYRLLFNTMTEGFALQEILCDAQGNPYDYRFLEMNPAFETLTGLKAENIAGRTVLEVMPDIEPFWIETYGRVALTGEPDHFEQYSGVLDCYYEVLAFRPAENQLATLFMDVTERKQAEERLEQRVRDRTVQLAQANADLQAEIQERLRAEDAVRAERKRFNDILEVLPAYLVLLTPDYHGSFANREFRRRFGESNGRRCFELLFERTEPCENCETYQVSQTNEPHYWEWLGPDGRTYDVSDLPFTEPDGSRLILEVGIDITERKQAQQALQEAHDLLEARVTERTAALAETNAYLRIEVAERRKAQEALRRAHDELEQRVLERTADLQASEERFRQLAESIHEVFWLLEPDSQRILYVSPAYDAIWGRSRQGLYERPESFLDTVHPDDQQQLLQGFTPGWQAYDAEFRIVRPDGTLRWIKLRSFPIQDQSGHVYRLAGVATDLTEQKTAEVALIRAERLAVAGKMAASLVHEINNPLQAVIGCLGLAEEALKSDQDPLNYLQIAYQEVQRTARIVSHLRSLARRNPRLVKEPTDLNRLLSDSLMLNKKQLVDHKIEAIVEADPGLGPVDVVPDSMRQVFLNLVLNAIDAMPQGGQLRLSTTSTGWPAGVRIVIADSGLGISPEDLPNLFEAFYSTKSEGLGLGLFVSQSIVEQHGGRIQVESQPGVGSTFTIWLPA
jgi:PAS domain S-box-containing protein